MTKLRAGIIPFYLPDDGSIQMLFMKPSDPKFGGEHFQIAKGRYEESESPMLAALREGHEELGLRDDKIGYVYYLGTFLGHTSIFLALVDNMEDFDPFDFETKETKWMTPEQFLIEGRDIHKPVIEKAQQYLTGTFFLQFKKLLCERGINENNSR